MESVDEKINTNYIVINSKTFFTWINATITIYWQELQFNSGPVLQNKRRFNAILYIVHGIINFKNACHNYSELNEKNH